MIWLLHWMLIGLYVAAPVAAAGWAMVKRRGTIVVKVLTMVFLGASLGTAATLVYAKIVGGVVGMGQMLLASYFMTAMLLLLKGFDAVLRKFIAARSSLAMNLFATFVRGVLIIIFGLPFFASAAITYRPKVISNENPTTDFGVQYTPVEFQATDGVKISGWWITAVQPRLRRRQMLPANFGQQTVIVCHGMGADKGSQLVVASKLLYSGYNALTFDFRAHGSSGGQLASMGDLERRDVLGAVRWLRSTHPLQAKRIVGVGVDTGAAALIGAATDPSADGQAIEALAVYGTFDDLQLLGRDMTKRQLLPPMDWVTNQLGLRLASLNVGVDLVHFQPAHLVQNLWPRPILIIHGSRDQLVPFDRGQELFDAATFPKEYLWLPEDDHKQSIHDEHAADAVRDFFATAKPMPVI